MKTKEFIKMLQEADPSGESHVRIDGGIPQFAHLVPGYYDGSYNYLDDNDNWVKSTEGTKVDIYSMDVWDFVEQHEDLEWEDVKSKFIFKMGSMNVDNRIETFLTKAKDAYDELKRIDEEIKNKN
jgi:hypothetical protein